MTAASIKLITFIVLLVHGIGHFQGIAAGIGLKINKASPSNSWLLKNMGGKANKQICLVLFLVTGIIGILTALSFKDIIVPEAHWQIMAVITAVLSTVCLIVFPNGFAMFFNKAGAIAVNIIIYYSIVFSQNWPAALFEN